MVDRLLIVVPEPEYKATRGILVEHAASGWERVISLASGPARRAAGRTASEEAQRILSLADQFGAESIIVTKEIFCDQKTLAARTDLELRRLSVGLLRKKFLKSELDARGLRWRKILDERLARWDSKKGDVDHWLNQFEQIGVRWVGEALLRQVDVVAPEELSGAFDVSAQVKLGTNLAFTFMLDDDFASSSNRIGAILTRIHGEINEFTDALKTTPSGSRLVVCEDALWTGTELRRLLERLKPGGDLEIPARGKRILFRHCVVSDYGLWAAHHFLDYYKLDTVELMLGERQRFIQVLGQNIDKQSVQPQWHLSPEDFDDWLSGQVRPLAFQDMHLWQNRHEEAQGICERIGVQLIERYLTEHKKPWSKEKFAIGAGRFGCTLMFSHSVPKVCLPLFWLGGPIEFNSCSIKWEPLIYDARRTLANASKSER